MIKGWNFKMAATSDRIFRAEGRKANSQVFDCTMRNEWQDIVEVSVPSEVIEGSAESSRVGDVGELATLRSVAPRKEKGKNSRLG
jgi:hypothetical protein